MANIDGSACLDEIFIVSQPQFATPPVLTIPKAPFGPRRTGCPKPERGNLLPASCCPSGRWRADRSPGSAAPRHRCGDRLRSSQLRIRSGHRPDGRGFDRLVRRMVIGKDAGVFGDNHAGAQAPGAPFTRTSFPWKLVSEEPSEPRVIQKRDVANHRHSKCALFKWQPRLEAAFLTTGAKTFGPLFQFRSYGAQVQFGLRHGPFGHSGDAPVDPSQPGQLGVDVGS